MASTFSQKWHYNLVQQEETDTMIQSEAPPASTKHRDKIKPKESMPLELGN
jgi:hypothetical protein